MTKEEFIYQWIYLDGFKLKPEDPMFDEVLSDLNSVIESNLHEFIDWHNLQYPDKYIPNSEIGKFNIFNLTK